MSTLKSTNKNLTSYIIYYNNYKGNFAIGKISIKKLFFDTYFALLKATGVHEMSATHFELRFNFG